MIFNIARKNLGFWLIFHFVLGVISAFTKYPLIIWVFIILFNSLSELFTKQNRNGVVHYFLSYYVGFEVWGRMVKASPWIPDESGKYYQFLFILFGLVFLPRGKAGGIGIALILLSIPSIFMAPWSFDYFRYDYMYNTMGFIVLGLAISYFKGITLQKAEIGYLMRLMMMGIVGILGFLVIKTPDLAEMEFGLLANAESVGGKGTNQISTILGIGIALYGVSWLFKQPLFPNKWIGFGMLIFLLFRILLTFSRGGAITGAFAMLLPFLYLTFIGKIKAKILGYGMVVLGILIGVIFSVNAFTGNMLFLRYSGETFATQAGLREKDANVITSGRLDIVINDFEQFFDHPILGVGPGRSPYERTNYEIGRKVAPHTLVTQLPAEHGIFGLIMSVIFLALPVIEFLKRKSLYEKVWMLMCFSLAILSSFHSATRTIITPFFYGLGLIHIIGTIPFNKPKSSQIAQIET